MTGPLFAWMVVMRICTGQEGCVNVGMEDAVYKGAEDCEVKKDELAAGTKSKRVTYRCQRIPVTLEAKLR